MESIYSEFLINIFGLNIGTTMVHEWAHLRWGVFDESASNGYPEFYYRDNSQEIEATRLVCYQLRYFTILPIEIRKITKTIQ